LIERRWQKQEREVQPKIAGLSLFRRILKPEMGSLLPYHIVRQSEDFSISTFHPTPKRILIRSDIASGTGIDYYVWEALPRKIFEVDPNAPANTQTEMRTYMKHIKGLYLQGDPGLPGSAATASYFPNSARRLLFILHPLRSLDHYAYIGSIGARKDREGKQQVKMKIGTDITNPIFRNTDRLPPKIPPALRKRIGAVAGALLKSGLVRFEVCFVTYKDRPDYPEYYDLLIRKIHA